MQAPKLAAKSYKVNGVQKQLTEEEYRDMQQYIGTKTKDIFSRFAKDYYFMKLPDETKAKRLQRILSEIGMSAKRDVLGNRKRRRR